MNEINSDEPVKLSICITTWNAEATIDKLLARLDLEIRERLSDTPTEVLVFDNMSQDGTREVLQKWTLDPHAGHLNLRTILSDSNLGQSKSRNRLTESARGQFVLFLDGDILPIPGSLRAMYDAFDLTWFMSTVEETPLGIFYDVKSDTSDPNRATQFETRINPNDYVTVNVPMFHYSIFLRDMLRNYPLPEFGPFGGTGWGVEEDMVGLRMAGCKGGFAEIKHRRFYHCPAGRSHNFLKANLALSRAKRWGLWALCSKLDPKLLPDYKGTTIPRYSVSLRLPKSRSLLQTAAFYAMQEFLPLDFSDRAEDQVLLFEHDCGGYALAKGEKVFMVDTRYSPVWLLANLPVVKTGPASAPYFLTDAMLEKFNSVQDLIAKVEGYSGVLTYSVGAHWICALLGIPTTYEDLDGTEGQSDEAIEDLGLAHEMDLFQVIGYRQVLQSAGLERVIMPLTTQLMGATGVA